MSTLVLVTVASVIFVAGISIVVPTLINIVGILGGRASGGAVALYAFILFVGAIAMGTEIPIMGENISAYSRLREKDFVTHSLFF